MAIALGADRIENTEESPSATPPTAIVDICPDGGAALATEIPSDIIHRTIPPHVIQIAALEAILLC